MKRIIDKRVKEKFMMDDAYLNGQAKICGWQATLAYNSLCRHANIDQESFPSIKLMSEELGVSRETIMKGISNLEKFNVIQIKKNRTKGGQWLNNTYILVDKSKWIKDQVANTDLVSHVGVSGTPSGCEPLDQVAVSHTKETHKQGNTYKETHPQEVNKIIFLFKEVNPSFELFYSRPPQRAAVERMLKTHGEELLIRVISYLPRSNSIAYLPTITSPIKLEEKWADLEAGIRKLKDKKLSNNTRVII